MYCEVNYCIYNKEQTCMIDGVTINQLGMCDSCELVAIPKKSLEKYKNKRLKEIEKIWGNCTMIDNSEKKRV